MREIEARLLLTMHYLTTTKPAALSAAKLRHSLGQRARHGTVLHPAEGCAEQLGPWRGVQQPLGHSLVMRSARPTPWSTRRSRARDGGMQLDRLLVEPLVLVPCAAPRKTCPSCMGKTLCCVWTAHTGGQRAGHTTQENVRCAEMASIEKQGPLSVRRSSCLQHGAAWHAYLLMCTVTISPCPWLRARITCEDDAGANGERSTA